MARQKAKIELTLFPFLSVLSGLIAVLMLFMIVTISTRVIDEELSAEEARYRPDEEVPPPTDPGDEESIDEKRHAQLLQEIDTLTGKLAERQRQQEELARNVQELEDLLENKKTEVLVPVKGTVRKGAQLGQPTPVNVVPVKQDEKLPGSKKKPIFIEVSATGYVVHPDKTNYPIIDKKAGGGPSDYVVDPALDRFLADVNKRRKDVYLLLLIHPNGTTAFYNITNYTLNHYREFGRKPGDQIDVGWEPFSREWLYIPK